MDLLTHVLVAYLVTYGLVGFQPSYLAAGALAGGLPDADALFFPIAKRFPILRHHGITHSIFGVTVIAVAGALVAPHLAPGNPWVFLLVMEVGGLCHVGQDAFTNFSVPPLLPFSHAQVHFDADRAVNFATLVASIVSFYLLLGVERNHVAFGLYLLTLNVLALGYGAYFAVRIAGRLWVGRRLKRGLGPYDHVVPTSSPLSWIVIAETVVDGRERTTWGRYVLGRGLVAGPYSVEAPIAAAATPSPPTSAAEALEQSLPLARHASRAIEGTYHFGEAAARPDGGWTAVWYSLEFTMFGRAAAVRVTFPGGGGPAQVRSAFYRPTQRSL
ncbi:MAG TPA: metal-dependent hydrolase [Thermoplasmata archaeon]|nr:metal-dependent hydrolase [Thermoplasmata archaeon]